MHYQPGEAYINSKHENLITTIEFYHPKSNSLPGHMLAALAKTIHLAGMHLNSQVIVLRSAGEGAFCAGANFDELLQIENEAQGLEFFMGFANVINAMRKCPKFIIGRIHGKSTGGGIGLIAACDYAIGMEGADIKLSELAVGIGPFVVGPVIERKIGLSAYSQLAMNAFTWHDAAWANAKSLYAELHTEINLMDASVLNLANKLAHSNPEATKALKETFWEGTEHWDEFLKERAQISGRLVLSDFTRKAINAFKQKKNDSN